MSVGCTRSCWIVDKRDIPAFLADAGQPAWVGSTVLALIGLLNIFGLLAACYLGSRVSKPWLLGGIYLGRAVAIAISVLLPITPASAFVFAALLNLPVKEAPVAAPALASKP